MRRPGPSRRSWSSQRLARFRRVHLAKIGVRRLAAAGLLAGALAVGCEPQPGPPAQPAGSGATGGATGSGSAPVPAPSGTGDRPPATGGAPPYTAEPPPAGSPGALATWAAPAGAVRYSAELWYAGVPVGRDGTGLLVAYPAMLFSSTGTRAVAHLKLPVFRCTARAGPASPNYRGCSRRRVEYADLAAPAVRASSGPGGRITILGQFPTYTYRAAVDRDPRRPARWTGRTYLVRVDAEPGPALPDRPGAFRGAALQGLGTVTLGSGTAAATAAVDRGYPNLVLLARRVPG